VARRWGGPFAAVLLGGLARLALHRLDRTPPSPSGSPPAVRFSAAEKRAAAARGISNIVSLAAMRIAPISFLVMWPRRQSSGSSQRGSALCRRPMSIRNQTCPRSRRAGPSWRAARARAAVDHLLGRRHAARWTRTSAAAISSGSSLGQQPLGELAILLLDLDRLEQGGEQPLAVAAADVLGVGGFIHSASIRAPRSIISTRLRRG
jgi:hypothetical protein